MAELAKDDHKVLKATGALRDPPHAATIGSYLRSKTAHAPKRLSYAILLFG